MYKNKTFINHMRGDGKMRKNIIGVIIIVLAFVLILAGNFTGENNSAISLHWS